MKSIKILEKRKALDFATGSGNLAQAKSLSKLLLYNLYTKAVISAPAGKP